MSLEPYQSPSPSALELLESCRVFAGSPPEFWQKFSEAYRELLGAQRVRMLLRSADGWKVLAVFPEERPAPLPLTEPQFKALADTALAEGWAQIALTGAIGRFLLLVRLKSDDKKSEVFAEIVLDDELDESLLGAVAMATDTPKMYLRNREVVRLQERFDHYARALDVLAMVNSHKKFSPASMAVVNELANRFGASRVTLGWLAQPYVRVVAVSGTEKFERKMAVLQELEAAMEECRDQDEELLWPAVLGTDSVLRDHQAYVKTCGAGAVVSVPIRFDNEVVGVVTLERENDPFDEMEACGLRVIADQIAPHLTTVRRQSRWFGWRWAQAWRAGLAKVLSPRHTWMKFGAIVGCVALLLTILVPFGYRVSSTFIIRPDSLAHMPAPIDGYIAAVHARPGDTVQAGALLFELEDRDLQLEEAEVLSEIRRHDAEAELAEAEGRLADLRVARATRQQAQARLELVQHRLSRVRVRAPFDGVIVQGDLRERLGAPVNQGEVLMQVSEMEGLYLEVRLPERDVDLIQDWNTGAVIFASRPDLQFPMGIEMVAPMTMADEKGNSFILRAQLLDETDWLRPGMTGVAKIDAGERTLWWRATHRIIDFIRMKFWI